MNRSILTGIMRVAWGNAVGQALTLGSSLVIARIFAPDTYGAFATLSAIIVTTGAISSLRLEASVPAIEDESEARRVVRSGLTVSVLSGVLTAIWVVLWGEQFAHSIGLASPVYLWLVPLAVTLVGLNSVSNQWILRRKRYGVVAFRVVIYALATAVAQIGAGLVAPTVGSLLIGTVVGQAAGLVLVLGRGLFLTPIGLRRAARVVLHYRESVMVLTPSTLVNTLGLHAPLLLGTYLFGTQFAGWFGMTQRFIALPLALMSMSVGQVMIGELGALRRTRDPDLMRYFLRASAYLGSLSVGVALLVASFGPLAFGVLLGEPFREAGYYARALAPGLAFQMVASPLAVILIIMGKPKFQAAWDVSRLGVVSLTLVLAAEVGRSSLTAVMFLGIANAGLYAAQWLLSRWAIKSGSAELGIDLNPVAMRGGR